MVEKHKYFELGKILFLLWKRDNHGNLIKNAAKNRTIIESALLFFYERTKSKQIGKEDQI